MCVLGGPYKGDAVRGTSRWTCEQVWGGGGKGNLYRGKGPHCCTYTIACAVCVWEGGGFLAGAGTTQLMVLTVLVCVSQLSHLGGRGKTRPLSPPLNPSHCPQTLVQPRLVSLMPADKEAD